MCLWITPLVAAFRAQPDTNLRSTRSRFVISVARSVAEISASALPGALEIRNIEPAQPGQHSFLEVMFRGSCDPNQQVRCLAQRPCGAEPIARAGPGYFLSRSRCISNNDASIVSAAARAGASSKAKVAAMRCLAKPASDLSPPLRASTPTR
jgi:hypothetical protein